MTGTNHALTGALIAGAIGQPLIVLPLAFASHFVLDSLPHYGEGPGNRAGLFKVVLTLDGLGLALGAATAVYTANYLPALAAILAISPDFFWIYRFTVKEKWGTVTVGPKHPFNAWHSRIQKYESRPGVAVELVWFTLFLILNIQFVL